MAVVILENKLTEEDVKKAREEYDSVIKITIDIEQEIVAIGGEYHADAERIMYEKFGSKNSNLWGGAYDLTEKVLTVHAMINRKPNLDNNSPDILDPKTRKKFVLLAEKIVKEIESLS